MTAELSTAFMASGLRPSPCGKLDPTSHGEQATFFPIAIHLFWWDHIDKKVELKSSLMPSSLNAVVAKTGWTKSKAFCRSNERIHLPLVF